LLRKKDSERKYRAKLKTSLNILIAPLEWGLGHATRMIPVAQYLKSLNHNVIIASGEKHISLFRSETEGFSYVDFHGFNPGYSAIFPQYLVLLLKTPVLIYHIISEHLRLKKIIKEHSVDIVISDNRFGLWNKNVTCAYVTHMPRIPFPKVFRFLEFVGIFLHRQIIRRYDLCLIPDLPGGINLSGRLSHSVRLPNNVRFSGILSRFQVSNKEVKPDKHASEYNLVILSGPEPQRTIMKKKVADALRTSNIETIILEGKPGNRVIEENVGPITMYNHLSSQKMKEMIYGSQFIVARSGYSTIMDLACLGQSALLIPTPGQTEQDYLAEYMSEKGWFKSVKQNKISQEIIQSVKENSFPDFLVRESKILLENAVNELLEKTHKKNQSKKS